ncbi:MAG TPA: glycosyltransferase [Chloroflexota bacterium]|nr:glycosyltransferase [Chloroflexota bacterium]
MSSPHVLLTTDQVGGVRDFCSTLRDALDARTTVLALGGTQPKQDADVLWAPLKLEWMQESAADVQRTREQVAEVVRERRIDVVHANQFAAACVDVDVPVVLTLHSDVLSWRRHVLGAEGVPAEWRDYVDLVREALGRANRVVAVSGFLADQVRELYGCDRQIEVVYNGWPAAPRTTQRRDITLLAGRIWDSAKNIQLAAHAALGWDAGAVYVAGDQHHPETGDAMPLQMPLKQLGFLEHRNLQEWLGRATIYLSPARYDPFGLLPLQAALSGAALLLSDIPSYRELWNGAARFFRSDDSDDLRQNWQALLAQPMERQRLADRARARATRVYSALRMAAEYTRLYESVLQAVAA